MVRDCQTHQLNLKSFWQEYIAKITKKEVSERFSSHWVMESSLELLFTTLSGTLQLSCWLITFILVYYLHEVHKIYICIISNVGW
jgi:hypothetical protein